ncbi:MAG TPA: efflux RND transporter periplasmic adaptor subunit [Candidatus Acidoferrum sp.]|nr:efflux RND transporter periplasmic adaptor subunit [Candidatus Acidoferrum sp.]
MSSPKPTLDDLRIERRPESAGASKSWLALAIVILAALAAAAYWWHGRTEAVEVRTVAAKASSGGGGSGAERTILNASGYVTARRQATVSAKVTGKVVEVDIEEGLKVKEGQVLAKLDDSNIRTSLDLAQAQLDSTRLTLEETRAQLKQADLAFQRTTALAKAQVASQADLETAESDAMTLRARVKRQEADITAAQRQIALWQQQIEDMIIRAPFDGVVTTKNAQPGEMISPISAGGGFTRTGIGTVVDMNSLEIELDVNESYINRVEPAQPAEAALDAYPDWKIPCKVIAIIPTADRQKATVKVRVGFDKLDPRILPDMAVKVAFRETADAPKSVTRAVIVPKSALQNLDGQDMIFTVEKGRAQRRQVTVSEAQGEDAVLSAGVVAGEKVIAEPPAGLKDGVAVKEKMP